MDAFDLILTVGLTARLTRFVVFDTAGSVVRLPLIKIADRVAPIRGYSWADELTSCPFCIGFWIALGVATTWAAFGSTTVWTVIALAATCSYVAGHAAATLDADRDGSW